MEATQVYLPPGHFTLHCDWNFIVYKTNNASSSTMHYHEISCCHAKSTTLSKKNDRLGHIQRSLKGREPSCSETYVYVRMYACICLHVFVCLFACLLACLYLRMYVYVRMYVCTYVRMYVCTYVSTYLSIYLSIHPSIYLTIYLTIYTKKQ